MRTIVLTRLESSDQGTFGVLTEGSSFICQTGELPWRLNKPEISCIPDRIYIVEWQPSKRFGAAYKLKDVQDRTDIQIHAGNFVGDEALGFKSESNGCILLGMSIQDGPQKRLFNSRIALHKLENMLMQKPFILAITNPLV